MWVLGGGAPRISDFGLEIQPMPLKERVFVCEAYGNICLRDLNAAINVASLSRDRVRMASSEFTSDQDKEPTPYVETVRKF
jgi:transposase